jgi:hypothetical protein
LIGSVDPVELELAALERSLAEPRRRAAYAELALLDVRDLFAGYLLDRAGLLAVADDAPQNDDLHPRVDLWAPKAAVDSLTGARNLEWLLGERRAWPAGFVDDPDPARLAAYRATSERFAAALEHYLRGEIVIQRRLAAGLGPWSAEVVDQQLAAYRLEPEFLPARPRLYAAAEADPVLAERVLTAMLERTPNDARVQRAWLAHLARSGDQARLEAARTAAALSSSPVPSDAAPP